MSRLVAILSLCAMFSLMPACGPDEDQPHGGGNHYVPTDNGSGHYDASVTSDVQTDTEFFVLKCCWSKSLVGTDKYVNFGGGVRVGSGFHWNIPLDSSGCGTSSGFYGVDNVTKGFWVKLTQGTAADDNWLDQLPPKSCTVDGGNSQVGRDAPGCGFGIYDAVNFDGSSDPCK